MAVLLACSSKDDAFDSLCDEVAIIGLQLYNEVDACNCSINDMNIVQDCLVINFSSSGCDANEWNVRLIDKEVVTETTSMPTRSLKLVVSHNQLCAAFLSTEKSFDVSSLQISGVSPLYLQINDQQVIEYKY
jgi:hypothetical protein